MSIKKFYDSVFASKLGTYIQLFIDAKRSSGSPYNSPRLILHHFDIFVAERFPNAVTLGDTIVCDELVKAIEGVTTNGKTKLQQG